MTLGMAGGFLLFVIVVTVDLYSQYRKQRASASGSSLIVNTPSYRKAKRVS